MGLSEKTTTMKHILSIAFVVYRMEIKHMPHQGSPYVSIQKKPQVCTSYIVRRENQKLKLK